ncbi:MAG TPA: DUF5985 family protein [Phycisphaerae bacterium]|nr:DUF5985 family protein [Phycisphaerae bacterium]
MAEAVYVSCALASLVCAILLLRGYNRSKARLLLWSSLCFVGLTINNGLLLFDKVLYPEMNLSLWRSGAALAGLLILLYGLVWEAEQK